jgi:hypothetical protein
MDPLSVAAGVVGLVSLVLDVLDFYNYALLRGVQLMSWYGPSGFMLFLFGSWATWRMQAQVPSYLASLETRTP